MGSVGGEVSVVFTAVVDDSKTLEGTGPAGEIFKET